MKYKKGYNFNLREDRASFGYVLNSQTIPTGAACLVHHLSIEPTYEVPYIHYFLTEEEIKEGFKVYNVPVDMCYCYRELGGEWTPCENFLITQRVYEPAAKIKGGLILPDNMNQPTRVKGVMYIVKGFDTEGGGKVDLSGHVAITTENCDYQIIWHEEDNKEYSLIRTRNREVMGLNNYLTERVNQKKLFLGLKELDCKTL